MQGTLVEEERGPDGATARTLTVFLTGRECAWRCVMCDLWKYTTAADTPPGAIPRQIEEALAQADRAALHTIKLYNASSFFDPRAVPEADYAAVGSLVRGFARVVVESHPALVGARVDRFAAALDGVPLEVAMGLETAHPVALAHLNKKMTVDQFRAAAAYLSERGHALRVFLLAPPPFVPAAEQQEWLLRSLDEALACGATAVSLVPTRLGNGALDELERRGEFTPAPLDDLEQWYAAALAHANGRARVFLDLWDLERWPGGSDISRRERLARMNREQRA